MAINYASKYAQKIDEKFASESVTALAVNNDYDFVGTRSVYVYKIPTAEMNDYTQTGTNRYGTPAELENSVQELRMTKDRSFTFTIDRGNFSDTQMANTAGAALKRQIREVVIPEIDKYRLQKMASGAYYTTTLNLTKNNTYDSFLKGVSYLLEANVPLVNTVAIVSTNFYKMIKEDSSFIRTGDISQKMLVKGQVGMIDGIPIIVGSASVLPDNLEFILVNKEAVTAPVKLAEYKIHDNPPGINGWLVEGRVYYDCFVLANKTHGVYAHWRS